jgi:hypothetical protein
MIYDKSNLVIDELVLFRQRANEHHSKSCTSNFSKSVAATFIGMRCMVPQV